jgi:hypothetical protein
VRYFQGLPRRLVDVKDADSETHAPSQHCSSLQARTPCTSYKGGHIKIKNSWSVVAVPKPAPPTTFTHLLHPEREGLISQRRLSSALLPKSRARACTPESGCGNPPGASSGPVFYFLGVRNRCRCYEHQRAANAHEKSLITPPVPADLFSMCARDSDARKPLEFLCHENGEPCTS